MKRVFGHLSHFAALWLIGLPVLAFLAWWSVDTSTRDALLQSRHIASSLILEDSRLRESVLRARYNIDHDYDGMNRQFMRIREAATRLLETTDSTPLAAEAADYAKAVEEEGARINRFKYLNAIVGNSLRYYDRGAHRLVRALPDDAIGNRLQHGIETFSVSALKLAGGDTSVDLETLAEGQRMIAESVARLGRWGAEFSRLPDHARIVFESVPALNGIALELTESRARSQLFQLDAALDAAIAREARQTARQWRISGSVSVAIFLLLASFAFRERRRAQAAEAEEKRQEALLRLREAALVSAANTVIITDREGRITWVNPAFSTLTGYTYDEAIGRNPRELFKSGRHDEAFYAGMWHALLDGRVWHGEIVNCYKDGSLHHEDMTIAPVLDEGGGVIQGFVAVKIDISARIETERALRAAKEAAEDAIRTKSEFLANMSHELRTPMNGVLGMAQLMETTQLDAEQQGYLRVIEESARKQMDVIGNILDYSALDTKNAGIATSAFDLREMIGNIAARYGEWARLQGLAFSVELSADLPDTVCGDPARLRQILERYLSNALKFTDSGAIRLSADRIEGPPACLRLTVRDTGPGIPPEQQAILFQPFVQIDGSSTRRHGGTGLGLAICHKLAELMGGRAGLESTPGQGSAFWVEFPIRADTL